MRFVLFICLSIFFVQCDDNNDVSTPDACFAFDVRQCGADAFADQVPVSDPVSEQENNMRQYLESHDIDVRDLYIDEDFHPFSCDACAVCPEDHRYFVKINADHRERIEALDFFELSAGDCADWF